MNHPSLAEVLTERCNHEWIDLDIRSIYLKNWMDPENDPEYRTDPTVSLTAAPCRSEWGTYSFDSVVYIGLQKTSREALATLDEKFPLGSINYYDNEAVSFVVPVDEQHYDVLIDATLRNPAGLRFRVAIPIWDDSEAKCLPLVQCQVFFASESEAGD